MVQISDLYVAFMLSGFPACFDGDWSKDEIENCDADCSAPIPGQPAEMHLSYREVV